MNRRTQRRIGIVQRVLPAYRVRLFDLLAEAYSGDVSVFAGEGRHEEMIAAATPEKVNYFPANNHHIFRDSFYFCWQSNLLEWLRQWDPDVLILEANPRYILSRAAVRWMRAKGGKVIGWGLGAKNIVKDVFGIRRTMRQIFLMQFDAMLTYSSRGASEYAALGMNKARIFVAPNAAAPKPTHALPERPPQYRAGKPIVVFVGRLQKRKKVDVLIRACAQISTNNQPRLWVIGDGPNRNALQELANNIYPRTEFFGARHGKDLAQRLKQADLFALPGTGGLAVQEAMSYGLPVIVGEADGTQTDLVRAENGWLLANATPDTLSELIDRALGDIESLRKKGEASFRIVSEEINLEAMVKTFQRVVDEVIDE